MTETTSRNPATQKRAKTWLTPEQIERIRDAWVSETVSVSVRCSECQTTDLEVYVDERREWERASWFTRQKWKLFGRE